MSEESEYRPKISSKKIHTYWSISYNKIFNQTYIPSRPILAELKSFKDIISTLNLEEQELKEMIDLYLMIESNNSSKRYMPTVYTFQRNINDTYRRYLDSHSDLSDEVF